MEKRPELLAPAGDAERLAAALYYGADAVYLGAEAFGMRASAQSFGGEALQKAVADAHAAGVKVYLTCNTLPRNDEVARLPAFLEHAAACSVDAFIVADIGVLALCKRYARQIPVHISTQAGIVNYEAACAFYELGASRVVLARELSLAEIAEIRQKTPSALELECFVHGAMCVSFSGRCLLSNYLTGRDANRGACAQPCRWAFALTEKSRDGQYFPISEEPDGTYILNSKDLRMIAHIPELVEAGVDSFKIEGRAKSAYYTAVITNAYRTALDGYLQAPSPDYRPAPWVVAETEKVSFRAYSTGFYFNAPDREANIDLAGGYRRPWEVSAVVLGYADGYLFCEQRNKFSVGDTLEALERGKPPFSFTVAELLDADKNPVDAAPHPTERVYIRTPHALAAGSLLRKQVEKG